MGYMTDISPTQGHCALCYEIAPLQDSHLGEACRACLVQDAALEDYRAGRMSA